MFFFLQEPCQRAALALLMFLRECGSGMREQVRTLPGADLREYRSRWINFWWMPISLN
jgi:hypothetical protein